MLAEYSVTWRYLLCALAVWRLTHLIVAEDGPWDSILKLRAALGDSQLGRAMDCFYCTSIWSALPCAFLVAERWPSRIVSWLALSATACLLERATNPEMRRAQPGKDHPT